MDAKFFNGIYEGDSPEGVKLGMQNETINNRTSRSILKIVEVTKHRNVHSVHCR